MICLKNKDFLKLLDFTPEEIAKFKAEAFRTVPDKSHGNSITDIGKMRFDHGFPAGFIIRRRKCEPVHDIAPAA